MHKPLDPLTRHRIQTLHSYATALEHGDLTRVAVVLHEAEQDAVLERMILELHNASLSEDQTPIHSDDVVPVQAFLHTYLMPPSAEIVTQNRPLPKVESLLLSEDLQREERILYDMSTSEQPLLDESPTPIIAPRKNPV